MIPAHPLALNAQRRLDERRQRALTRYYIEAGAGGLAVGVHTTQFAIRKADVGLYQPVLELAARTATQYTHRPVLIAGVVGPTQQAVREAGIARDLGYDAVLLSLAGLGDLSESQLVQHCRFVGEVLPLIGFYLQPAVGGIALSYNFWRQIAEIDALVAIKVAPFNRYQTLNVVRGVADSGRADYIALYTGNDDTILYDLLSSFQVTPQSPRINFVGGLLGHWSVWTREAVRLYERARELVQTQTDIPGEMTRLAWQVTDANAAFFDASNNFRGCIAGLHEVLSRQGLLEGIWCLDPDEGLSAGQSAEIDRVYKAYPHLNDDDFVAQHRDDWLR